MDSKTRSGLTTIWAIFAIAFFADIFFSTSFGLLVPASAFASFLSYQAHAANTRSGVVRFLVFAIIYLVLAAPMVLAGFGIQGGQGWQSAFIWLAFSLAPAFLSILAGAFAYYEIRKSAESA